MHFGDYKKMALAQRMCVAYDAEILGLFQIVLVCLRSRIAMRTVSADACFGEGIGREHKDIIAVRSVSL